MKINRTQRALIKGLILILTLVGVFYGLKAMGLSSALDETWADAYLRGKGTSGYVLFLAVATVFTAVGLPRQIIAFLGGYTFGFMTGTLLALFGTTLGCALAFYYARFMGQSSVTRRYGHRIEKINAILRTSPFTMTLLIRCLPVGSNVLTNLVAGVSTVPALWFILGSLLGYIPQTVIFALVGEGVHVDPVFHTMLGAGLFLLSGVMGYFLYRRYRLARELNEDDEE
jgi:uncharacterized membrane protein YdjX (TVP38/TMEM64 family)